jgi:hypothetical protein
VGFGKLIGLLEMKISLGKKKNPHLHGGVKKGVLT